MERKYAFIPNTDATTKKMSIRKLLAYFQPAKPNAMNYSELR